MAEWFKFNMTYEQAMEVAEEYGVPWGRAGESRHWRPAAPPKPKRSDEEVIAKVVAELDRLGVSVDVSQTEAYRQHHAAGLKRRKALVMQAQRQRAERQP